MYEPWRIEFDLEIISEKCEKWTDESEKIKLQPEMMEKKVSLRTNNRKK